MNKTSKLPRVTRKTADASARAFLRGFKADATFAIDKTASSLTVSVGGGEPKAAVEDAVGAMLSTAEAFECGRNRDKIIIRPIAAKTVAPAKAPAEVKSK